MIGSDNFLVVTKMSWRKTTRYEGKVEEKVKMIE
jgi:hypothetical protein